MVDELRAFIMLFRDYVQDFSSKADSWVERAMDIVITLASLSLKGN